MKIPSLEEMLAAGVHFGHQTSRWHPKMAPFIFGQRGGVHFLDLEKTKAKLEETLQAVKEITAAGHKILFVSTKPQALAIVKKAAEDCAMPYLVERWLGGLLTNFPEIKKLLKTYRKMKEEESTGEWEKYTKKERGVITERLKKMDESLSGLISVEEKPYAIFVPAMQREKTAITEATKTGVKVIGICDTNSNPSKADYFVPANDDAVRSIEMMVNLVAEAAKEGREEFEKNLSKEKTLETNKKKEDKPIV